MSRQAYLVADTIVSPLGFSTSENLESLRNHQTGITAVHDPTLWADTFYAARIQNDQLQAAWQQIATNTDLTKLEKMMLLAVCKLAKENPSLDLTTAKIIIATTKGNIDALATAHPEKAYLHNLAKQLQNFLALPATPLVVSNACISGGLAIAVAKRMIQAAQCDDVVVIGGDILSSFTTSGFFSFQAVSPQACKPFCKHRSGVSLGEAAAALWVSATHSTTNESVVALTGDATANDANHISGPSRTGEGLYISIQKALDEANLMSDQIDYISAHGTATPFNDEMEAIAFNRAGVATAPVNSLKGYYGHTLGASALIETIIAKHALLENELIASLGFQELGVSQPLAIITSYQKQSLQRVLKTASGFGGCNVALVLEKIKV